MSFPIIAITYHMLKLKISLTTENETSLIFPPFLYANITSNAIVVNMRFYSRKKASMNSVLKPRLKGFLYSCGIQDNQLGFFCLEEFIFFKAENPNLCHSCKALWQVYDWQQCL